MQEGGNVVYGLQPIDNFVPIDWLINLRNCNKVEIADGGAIYNDMARSSRGSQLVIVGPGQAVYNGPNACVKEEDAFNNGRIYNGLINLQLKQVNPGLMNLGYVRSEYVSGGATIINKLMQ